MILFGSVAIIAMIHGYADAADTGNVPAASDLQERMLNEQNKNDGGIVAFGSAGVSKSESAKSGLELELERIDAVDKFVALSFATVGFLGLLHKINEEESIDILSRIIRKANDLEVVIGTIDEDGGTRRLQTFGTNDNLFVAYIQVSVLKLQGLNDQAILDQLTMMFTERVVSSIAGVLDPTVATTTSTTGATSTVVTTGVTTTGQTSTVVTTGATMTGQTSTAVTTEATTTGQTSTVLTTGVTTTGQTSTVVTTGATTTEQTSTTVTTEATSTSSTSTELTSTSSTSTTTGCPTLPNDGTGGTAGVLQSCSDNTDCFGCKLYLYCLRFHRLINVNL